MAWCNDIKFPHRDQHPAVIADQENLQRQPFAHQRKAMFPRPPANLVEEIGRPGHGRQLRDLLDSVGVQDVRQHLVACAG